MNHPETVEAKQEVFRKDWDLFISETPTYRSIYLRPNKQLLKKFSLMKDIKKILDIGCGPQPISDYFFDPLNKSVEGRSRVLLDVQPRVTELRTRDDNPEVVCFDMCESRNTSARNYKDFAKIVLEEKFDLIMMINVLNYIKWELALEVGSSIQTKGGLIYVLNHSRAGYQGSFYDEVFNPTQRDIIQKLSGLGYEIPYFEDEDVLLNSTTNTIGRKN